MLSTLKKICGIISFYVIKLKITTLESINNVVVYVCLQEDLMKWRNAALGNDGNLAAARGLTSQSNSQLSPTSTSVLIAIAMVIVGYLLGKLI